MRRLRPRSAPGVAAVWVASTRTTDRARPSRYGVANKRRTISQVPPKSSVGWTTMQLPKVSLSRPQPYSDDCVLASGGQDTAFAGVFPAAVQPFSAADRGSWHTQRAFPGKLNLVSKVSPRRFVVWTHFTNRKVPLQKGLQGLWQGPSRPLNLSSGLSTVGGAPPMSRQSPTHPRYAECPGRPKASDKSSD